jgi:predicted membrane channel-forming protein YqfA (hemolysin III family)
MAKSAKKAVSNWKYEDYIAIVVIFVSSYLTTEQNEFKMHIARLSPTHTSMPFEAIIDYILQDSTSLSYFKH